MDGWMDRAKGGGYKSQNDLTTVLTPIIHIFSDRYGRIKGTNKQTNEQTNKRVVEKTSMVMYVSRSNATVLPSFLPSNNDNTRT